MSTPARPALIAPTIQGKGQRIVVGGKLQFEIDARAVAKASKVGHVSVAIPGDELGHVLIPHQGRVMEVQLDPAMAKKVAQLLRAKYALPSVKVPPIRQWIAPTMSGELLIQLGNRVHHVPVGALVAYTGRGSQMRALVLWHGIVRVLGPRGEGVLPPGAARSLARDWNQIAL